MVADALLHTIEYGGDNQMETCYGGEVGCIRNQNNIVKFVMFCFACRIPLFIFQ